MLALFLCCFFVLPAVAQEDAELKLRVVNHVGYLDTTGEVTRLEVLGIALNNQTVNVGSINVTAKLFNFEGVFIKEVMWPAATTIVESGGTTPFEVTATVDSNFSTYELMASGFETGDKPVGSLELVNETSFLAGEYYMVEGLVRNNGSLRARSIKVFCAFYDSQQNLIGMTSATPSRLSLYPSQTVDFAVSSNPFKIDPADFVLYATAREFEVVFEANYILLTLLVLVFLGFLFYMKRIRGW